MRLSQCFLVHQNNWEFNFSLPLSHNRQWTGLKTTSKWYRVLAIICSSSLPLSSSVLFFCLFRALRFHSFMSSLGYWSRSYKFNFRIFKNVTECLLLLFCHFKHENLRLKMSSRKNRRTRISDSVRTLLTDCVMDSTSIHR